MSKNEPLVSVMIPVFNRQDYIGAAIKSVLSQSYKSFELVIHDDNSSDDSLKVIKSFHDPRIRVIHTNSNHGMIGGWNYLLKKAKGKYIKQMGSDDLLAKNCLKEQVRVLEAHKSVSLVTCQRVVINERGVKTKTFQFSDSSCLINGIDHAHWILTTIRENKIGEPCATMFRRKDLKEGGMFDPTFSQFADFEYWIRILSRGDLYYLHKPLCYFRMHEGSNTTKAILDGRFITEIFKLIDKYYLPAGALAKEGKDQNYAKIYGLAESDRKSVTKLKILDTLKNIKDLVFAGHVSQALRYTARLVF